MPIMRPEAYTGILGGGAGRPRPIDRGWLGLGGVVLAHLLLLAAHGHAHRQAAIGLSAGASLFVYVVILAGPPVGLAVMRHAPRHGALLVGWSLAGALVFGVANHFLLSGPDQVARVTGEYRPLFAVTACLLAGSEAGGAALAWGLVRKEKRS